MAGMTIFLGWLFGVPEILSLSAWNLGREVGAYLTSTRSPLVISLSTSDARGMDWLSALILDLGAIAYGERDRSLDIIILLTHFGYRIWVVLKITRENV